jgi:hypothetical protein
MLLLALSLFANSAETVSPVWLQQYGEAREQGRSESKPVAVFIGSGSSGWHQVSRDGQLDSEVKEVLADSYVCLYVNTDNDSGRELASAFGISDGPGLVISSHSGKVQVFSHQGDLENGDLSHFLRRYADSKRIVRFTESIEQQQSDREIEGHGFRSYVPGGASGRSC